MPLKHFLALFIFVVAALLGSALGAEELSVHFKTTPGLELLRPFAGPVEFALLVTGGDGRPVKEGAVAIRLDAPSPGVLFSTDYPHVEGTLLSELRLPLRQGKTNWKYLFPIRGEYRLAVEIAAKDGRRVSKTFHFHIRENQQKWLALGAVSAALFVLGFVAGRIFTGTRANAISLIAAALFVSATAYADAQNEAVADAAVLKIEPATVGRPSELRWSLPRDAGHRTAMLTLTITHLEKEKIVFAVEKIPVAGEWSMRFHFPDGAQYRVVAIGNVPGLVPLRTEQVVSVAGVEPAAGPRVRALVYFIGLIALGLAAGRWSKRRSISFA